MPTRMQFASLFNECVEDRQAYWYLLIEGNFHKLLLNIITIVLKLSRAENAVQLIRSGLATLIIAIL